MKVCHWVPLALRQGPNCLQFAAAAVVAGALFGLLCGSLSAAEPQNMHLVAGDAAPTPGRSLLRIVKPQKLPDETAHPKSEIRPASGQVEVIDGPTAGEVRYYQSARARVLRHIGHGTLRPVSDTGEGLGLPQPPPDREPRTANLQPKENDDLFAPPAEGGNSAPLQNPKPKIQNEPTPPLPDSVPAPMVEPVPRAEPAPRVEPAPMAPLEPAPAEPGMGNQLEVLTSSGELTVTRRRNKILRSKDNIYRVAVVDPSVCDVVQFTPREVSVIGRGQGATNVTFWFADGKHKPLTYLVKVVPDPEIQVERERQYEIFEEVLAELFPDSKVRLTPVADKLIVRGQARDAEEAAQILTIIRGEALAGRGNNNGGGYGYNANTLSDGPAANVLSNDATGNPLPASNIVNMLRIPGVQQVALRVKIAELNRSAARHFGTNLDMQFNVGNGILVLQSLLNPPGTASIIGSFDNDQINFGIHFLKKHGVLRILSEPTLVTLSGRPASFVAGGEFAVPTTVGVDGAAAVTTDFRAFGVILNFLPTVIDKDRVRLEISPEFSKVNSELSVNGTPGLTTRAVTTTVEMREGQSLAIAGLLEDSMEAKKEGDVPFISTLLGKREVARNETELIILVTPELVHPLDPEEVPPLPGFDVTEPTDGQFFLAGRIEGTPTQEMRSTVWPRLRNRYRHGGPAMISGPFGHGQ